MRICNKRILMIFQQSCFFLNLKHLYSNLLLEFSSSHLVRERWYLISNNSFRLDSLKPRSSTRLTSLHVSGLFSWPDEVAVSPSTSTPTVLRHHTVSPHYVSSDMQSSAGNHCNMAETDQDNVFGCVCVCLSPSLSVFVCLDRLPSQWWHCSCDFTYRGYRVQHHLPKWINTHNLSVSYRLSLKCSVQAQYGNVVKWPTGISDRIRDHRDLVVRPILLHQNLDT